MRDAIFLRAGGLVLRKLTKIIVEAISRFTIKACPESRLTNGRTTCQSHRFIVISRATDHVSMGLDISHRIRV